MHSKASNPLILLRKSIARSINTRAASISPVSESGILHIPRFPARSSSSSSTTTTTKKSSRSKAHGIGMATTTISTAAGTQTATAGSSGATASALKHAKLTPRRSSDRGHADHGWLKTYHTFSFADYWDPAHMQFGSVRVLNEDRVAPRTGFPTHPHRDAEIFSYVVSGELTHRDSMVARGSEAGRASADDFSRMRRGDVQFTTGGSGIAHSEKNEHPADWAHFLQIWALPWKKGLTPRYHTRSFSEEEKRKAVVPILTPLKAGPQASGPEEAEARPSLEGTIPIHADLIFGAAILPPGEKRQYGIGGTSFGEGVVRKREGRRTYVHLITTGGSSGKGRIRIDGREELKEGDGCYIENLVSGDKLQIENLGPTDAECVILDSD